ncbi:MAG: MBOAT family protein [Clostridia bacterium]|nr:MBOAT family protein [Clostridia bacterium]
MLFNSLAFAFFMPLVFFLYWALPHKLRWMMLLIANAMFYMSWEPKYLLVIVAMTIVSYLCARLMEKSKNGKQKKVILIVGILLTLASLLFFKYTNFTLSSIGQILKMCSVPVGEYTLKLMMPIGISFYTFQMVGYLADVYKGKITAQHHIGKYALFVSFFPNILSGPIERAGNMFVQFDEEKTFDYQETVYGLRLILLGFLKKMVFADSMSKYVDQIFDHATQYQGLGLIIAIILFTFQIYCDFSGYSDIAIGVARLLGIQLMTNFKQPYYAGSVKEFWSRWHISLSSWFRDYVYIPLGGNRVSKARRNLNLMITFLASGLWHGANWTYVLWGGIHGIYQIVENTVTELIHGKGKKPSTSVFNRLLHVLLTFILVSFAWMFFRANSISDAWYIMTHMFSGFDWNQAMADTTMSYLSIAKTSAAILFLVVFDFFQQKRDLLKDMDRLKLPVRWLIYVLFTVIVIVLSLHNGVKQEFIYFKF